MATLLQVDFYITDEDFELICRSYPGLLWNRFVAGAVIEIEEALRAKITIDNLVKEMRK